MVFYSHRGLFQLRRRKRVSKPAQAAGRTMEHLYTRMRVFAVLLIFASCAWQSPWPLTTKSQPVLADDWRTRRSGGLRELGPLSVITLIRPALCTAWLVTGFISFPSTPSFSSSVKFCFMRLRQLCKESVKEEVVPFYSSFLYISW